ncbi:MAG: TetR/AcrR family transcriptional regulator [Ruminococcus sp.]
MENDKKTRILDAMEQLMCIMPNQEISVNLIAEKANIGKGSIYYYFESKEEILCEVVIRCYQKAIHEYFSVIQTGTSALEKIKVLFHSMIQKEFHDHQVNVIRTLHLHENMLLHNQMKTVAIQEVAPIMEELLIQGTREGTFQTETPKESAEIIVAVLTLFLDNTVFPSDDEGMLRKLKVFSNVLDTCLHAAPGSFDFLWQSREQV